MHFSTKTYLSTFLNLFFCYNDVILFFVSESVKITICGQKCLSFEIISPLRTRKFRSLMAFIFSEIMSSKIKYSGKQRLYKLFAVVYHEGVEAVKGHYVTDTYHGQAGWIR